MNHSMLFGETYTQRSAGDIPSVRFYKGKPVPWNPHDCSGENSCSFCRRQKREFVASLSEPVETPVAQHKFEEGGQQGRCYRCAAPLESAIHLDDAIGLEF